MTMGLDISRITQTNPSRKTQGNEDQQLLKLLKTNEEQDEMGIDLIDMGQIEDEERPFMIVDKDTGHVYDIRRPDHVDALTNQQSVRSSSTVGSVSVKSSSEKPTWNSWWDHKRKNNNDYLNAAEGGYL